MQTYLRWLLGATLYVGCAQFAFLAFIQNPGNPDDFDKARLPEMVEGTAYRPFVYRTLLPTTVGWVEAALPNAAKDRVERAARGFEPLAELLASTPAADERFPVTYLIAYALEFACLIGFALTLRVAILHFYSPPVLLADLLPVVALVCLPVFYRYISYDYDFPQLFLFTGGLLLLDRQRWRWFYPVLVLGALSKETTVLLVLVHLLGHWDRMPRRVLWIHGAAQLLVVVLVRILLQSVLFADNPGAPVEKWYLRNWEMISNPSRWGFLFFHFAWVGRSVLVVPTNYNLVFLLVVPVIVWNWSDKPVLLRRGLWIVPVLAVCTFCFGHFDEMRDYYEAYPVVFLLGAGTLCRWGKSAGAAATVPSTAQAP